MKYSGCNEVAEPKKIDYEKAYYEMSNRVDNLYKILNEKDATIEALAKEVVRLKTN